MTEPTATRWRPSSTRWRLDRGGGARPRARSTLSRRGAGGAAVRGHCAGCRPARARARDPVAGRRGRTSGGPPAGWPPNAGSGRSAPSRWRPRCAPARGCSGCRRWWRSAAAAVRRRRLRRGLVPRRPVHDAGEVRRAGRAAPRAGRRRPARPAGLHRRRPAAAAAARGQQFPSSAEVANCWPRPASAHRRPRRPTSAEARRSGPSGPTPWTPRFERRHGSDPAYRGRGAVGLGWVGCSARARCGPGSVRAVTADACTPDGCKGTPCKGGLCYSICVCVDAR